jgi:basic membrane protein A
MGFFDFNQEEILPYSETNVAKRNSRVSNNMANLREEMNMIKEYEASSNKIKKEMALEETAKGLVNSTMIERRKRNHEEGILKESLMRKTLVSYLTETTLKGLVFDRDFYYSQEVYLREELNKFFDKSFNEGAWKGVLKYATDNNKTYAYYRPSEDSLASRVETMENAIKKGATMVVCPGFLFEEAVFELQDEHPNVSFLLLDGQPHNADNTNKTIGKNVFCIFYNEEQAGYFAGYAAVMDGYRKLGFIGGIAVPAVMRFGWGYIQGANDAAKKLSLDPGAVSIKYNYAGAFTPTPELATKMSGWYTSGTEVVFACGGAIYLNVTNAAEASNKKVIGVDVDQEAQSKTIITSAMKELTTSVVLALTQYYNNGGKWTDTQAGKVVTLGVNDNCVGLPTAQASWRFNTFTVAEYNQLFDDVKTGKIVVDQEIGVVDNSNEFIKYKSMITHVTVDFAA